MYLLGKDIQKKKKQQKRMKTVPTTSSILFFSYWWKQIHDQWYWKVTQCLHIAFSIRCTSDNRNILKLDRDNMYVIKKKQLIKLSFDFCTKLCLKSLVDNFENT